MKAEHRKALQTNTLADFVGRTVRGARGGTGIPWFMIFGVLFVGAVLWIYFGIMRPNWARADAEAWADLNYNDIKSLNTLETEYKDTKQGKAAVLMDAFRFVWIDVQALGSANPGKVQDAVVQLQKATRYLEALAEDFKDDKEFLAEAKYHLAVAEESMAAVSPQNLEKAKKRFEEASEGDLSSTAYGILAKKRLEQYNNPAEFEAIDRFYKEYQIRTQLGRFGQ